MDEESINKFVFDKYNSNADFNNFNEFIQEFQYRVGEQFGEGLKVLNQNAGTVGEYSSGVCKYILADICDRNVTECCIKVQCSSEVCFVRIFRDKIEEKKGSVYRFVSL